MGIILCPDFPKVTCKNDGAKLIKKSAEGGYAVAQDLMGHVYFPSDNIKELKKASEWFKKSAKLGFADAELMLKRNY